MSIEHDAYQRQLPSYVTRFIGREHELARLAPYLSRSRLLTLVGTGGSGKTRLATELARHACLASESLAVIRWVDLAQVADADGLLGAVAVALGLREMTREDPVSTVVEALGAVPTLLVLDNCEQIADHCGQLLTSLLPSCPHLSVLTTSRTPLGTPGEQVFTVPPLGTTPSSPEETGAGVSEAAQLFLDRAEMVMPGYRLLGEDLGEVDALVARLDGSPLAIELAASWSRVLSARELLAEVDRNLETLSSPTPTVAPRHRSIRAVLDSSWRLLSEHERSVLRGLSVFTSTFSRDAAVAVAGADLVSLLSLAEKSLVHRLPETLSGTRFRMHEVVREYAADRLVDCAGEGDHVRTRLFDYLLGLLPPRPEDRFAVEPRLLDQLLHEQANLKAALLWAADRKDADRALRLAAGLWGLSLYATPVTFFTDAVDRALALPSDADNETTATNRAQATYVSGYGAVYASDHQGGATRFSEASAQFSRLGDLRMVGKCLQGSSYCLTLSGDPEGAEGLEERGLEIFQRLGDARGLAWSILDIGEIALARGDTGRAQRFLYEGWTRFEQTEQAYGSYRAGSMLGDVYRLKRDWTRALSWYRRALDFHRQLGMVTGGGEILEGLAQIAVALHQPVHAARLFGAGASWRRTYGLARYYFYVADYRQSLALAHAELGDGGWHAAFAEGQRLTSDQATDDAVRATTELIVLAEGRPASDLTVRQMEIVRLVAEGMGNAEIAGRLVVSPRTVDAHLRAVFEKLGVGTRTAAVHEAARLNLI